MAQSRCIIAVDACRGFPSHNYPLYCLPRFCLSQTLGWHSGEAFSKAGTGPRELPPPCATEQGEQLDGVATRQPAQHAAWTECHRVFSLPRYTNSTEFPTSITPGRRYFQLLQTFGTEDVSLSLAALNKLPMIGHRCRTFTAWLRSLFTGGQNFIHPRFIMCTELRDIIATLIKGANKDGAPVHLLPHEGLRLFLEVPYPGLCRGEVSKRKTEGVREQQRDKRR